MKKVIRNLKIASVLHKAISRVLIKGKVILHKKITISKVELSKDLKSANVYIIPSASLNTEDDPYNLNGLIKEINKQYSHLIRKSILDYINLKFVPKLIFKKDLSIQSFIELNKIFNNKT